MKFSSVLPVHIMLFILSLDEDSFGRAEPSTLISYPELSANHIVRHSHELGRRRDLNMTRRTTGYERAEEDVICHPAGSCEPCSEDLLHEPFCQPFGNRRLLHCLAISSLPDANTPPKETPPDKEQGQANTSHEPPSHHPASRPPQSALPAWESCGRRVPKERADFFEFVLCNVIFAALALSGVLIRSERMRTVRARRLAARIGVGLRRASSGSWVAMGGRGAAVAPEDNAEEEGLMREEASGS